MAGYASVFSGLIYLGTQVSGSGGSYDSRTYGDAENAALRTAPPPVPLVYPHFVVILPTEEQPFFRSMGMMGTGGEYPPFQVKHFCHFKPVANSPDFLFNGPDEGTVMDNYWAACLANPFFTGTTAPSVNSGYDVTVHAIKTQLLNIEHHTIVFTHTVEIFR